MTLYIKESNNNSGNSSGGISFCGMLTILFVALKLTNVIDWSWLWVLSPIWIPVAIAVAVIIAISIIPGE